MNWQDKTSGGYPVRITARDPGSRYPIVGEITLKGSEMSVRWTREGRYDPTEKSTFDLVPVEQSEESLPIISEPPTYDFPLPLRSKGICRVPVPMRLYDPTELKGLKIPQAGGDFRKFVDKAQAGELPFTCSFVWEGPRAKVGDRIQHPNGCWLEITESGFKIEAALNTIEFTG
jgi:hypothetical protein